MNDDRLQSAIDRMPSPEVPADVARRVGNAAHAVYARAASQPGWQVALTRSWSHVVLPAGLAGIVGVYLTWAVRVCATLVQ